MNQIVHFYRNILCTCIPFIAVSYKQIFKQSLLTEKQNVYIVFSFPVTLSRFVLSLLCILVSETVDVDQSTTVGLRD
jgi:hypothetical protein